MSFLPVPSSTVSAMKKNNFEAAEMDESKDSYTYLELNVARELKADSILKIVEIFSNLEKVDLSYSPLAVDDLLPLSKLPNLEELVLWQCDKIGKSQLAALKKALPQVTIRVEKPEYSLHCKGSS